MHLIIHSKSDIYSLFSTNCHATFQAVQVSDKYITDSEKKKVNKHMINDMWYNKKCVIKDNAGITK